MEMLKRVLGASIVAMFALPCAVSGTELYDLTIMMPISEAGGEVELRQVTFNTYYSPLETRVGVVAWDPCQAKGQTEDCSLVNPVNAINLGVALHLYNAGDIYDIDSCYIELDLRELKPLAGELRTALGQDAPKAEVLRLTLQSIEQNTRGSDYYSDCEYRLRGLEQHSELADFEVPTHLSPTVAPCQPYTRAGRERAIAFNNQGMDYYRRKDWKPAAQSFRQAAEQDCSYFIALTNMASVLALQKKYHQAQSVLWRAHKLDPGRTLKKLETDSDYLGLKQHSNFYSASSAIGMSYRRYCFKPADPAEVNPERPSLIDKSSISEWNIRYSVATRYAFKSDFNKNGVADWVYPLVSARLSELLVVFDGAVVPT